MKVVKEAADSRKVAKADKPKPGKPRPYAENRPAKADTGKKRPPKPVRSEDAPSNKKRALRRERMSSRPHFDTVEAAKALWNQLRDRACEAETRTRLIGQLLDGMRGAMCAIATKHDGSRVLQAVVQFGDASQRSTVLAELGAKLAELSKLQYSHYVVLKLLKHCTLTERQQGELAAHLRGHIVTLGTHAVGAKVVEAAFKALGARSRALRVEFYGREHAIFAEVDGKDAALTLTAILRARPDRAAKQLDQFAATLQRFVDKGLLAFLFVHELVWEYLRVGGARRTRELAPALVDASLQLLATRPGALAIARCITCGDPKTRKRVLKVRAPSPPPARLSRKERG